MVGGVGGPELSGNRGGAENLGVDRLKLDWEALYRLCLFGIAHESFLVGTNQYIQLLTV